MHVYIFEFQAVIKSAAGAASRKPKIQRSAPAQMETARLAGDGLGVRTWILGCLEAALAADSIAA